MESLFSLFDDKFWSILTMPIGLTLCFAPAMIAWKLTEGSKQSSQEQKHDK